jgi:hypothetical protein
MRFGFGGHVEGKEPIDPKPMSENLQKAVQHIIFA